MGKPTVPNDIVEFVFVVGIEESNVVAQHLLDFRYPANAGGQNRTPACHGFKNDVRERFVNGIEDEEVRGPQVLEDPFSRDSTLEPNPIRHSLVVDDGAPPLIRPAGTV